MVVFAVCASRVWYMAAVVYQPKCERCGTHDVWLVYELVGADAAAPVGDGPSSIDSVQRGPRYCLHF